MKKSGKKKQVKQLKNQKENIKKETPPLISAIMPCLNGQKTIAGAINSILSQTYKNWELIIVDDGSEDETEKIVAGFTDRRIKYHRREHCGIPATRNFGNSKARGIYCIVQDADDYSMPNRFEKVIKAFRETDADIITHSAYVNSWNEQYKCLERNYLKALPADKEKITISQYLPGWPAYKRKVWERKPFREETRYAYDWMMWVDWIFSGFKIEVLDEGLYEYVRYFGSASDRFERSGEREKAFETIKRIIKQEYEN